MLGDIHCVPYMEQGVDISITYFYTATPSNYQIILRLNVTHNYFLNTNCDANGLIVASLSTVVLNSRDW